MDKAIMQPVISVIMPVFNCGPFVGEAIDSILQQTFTNFELIIIDDCSTDQTCFIVNSYTDPRIRFIEKSENTGLVASLNLGIVSARGDFLARMDGDDISHPERFRHQLDFLQANPEISLCGTWYQVLPSKELVELPTDFVSVKMALLEYCALGHPTIMVRREFLIANKLFYDEDFKAAEDYDLWTRIAAIGRMANLPMLLLSYRVHANQVTANEQYNQVSNSNLCRIRMLCYPLGERLPSDTKTGELIVNNAKLKNHLELNAVLSWLNRLAEHNAMVSFYHLGKFENFISEKKKLIIRSYFLHNTRYAPSVLFQFIQSSEFRKYFTVMELVKFYLKCIFYWK